MMQTALNPVSVFSFYITVQIKYKSILELETSQQATKLRLKYILLKEFSSDPVAALLPRLYLYM